MDGTNGTAPADSGFELQGRFYKLTVSDVGKDLMLIDRFAGIPADDFFSLIEDDVDRRRTPIILALIATSVRAGNPSWTVERITRLVMDTPFSEIVWIDADAKGDDEIPPAAGGLTPPTSERLPAAS